MTPDKRVLVSGVIPWQTILTISDRRGELMANVWTNGHLRRILVGYDGSVESEKALETALALSDGTDSKVLVLSVARPSEPESIGCAKTLDAAHEELKKVLSRLRCRVQQNGIQIETQVAVGHPAQEILRNAEQNQVDLIVVGHRGISAIKELTLGSISEHVLSHAPCPVMVTR
jgi:nucleotide-binding universal stress UspA family protein